MGGTGVSDRDPGVSRVGQPRPWADRGPSAAGPPATPRPPVAASLCGDSVTSHPIGGPEWLECIRSMYRWTLNRRNNTPGAARLSTLPPRFYVEGVGAMGRGRQKAKQTKVARALKYYSPETNYQALEQELTGHSHTDLATDPRYGARSSEDNNGDYDQPFTGWSDDR